LVQDPGSGPADYLPYQCCFSALGLLYLFHPERATSRSYLAGDGPDQYLAHPALIHYFRYGGLFFHAQEELEGIAQGPRKTNSTAPYFWFLFHRSH